MIVICYNLKLSILIHFDIFWKKVFFSGSIGKRNITLKVTLIMFRYTKMHQLQCNVGQDMSANSQLSTVFIQKALPIHLLIQKDLQWISILFFGIEEEQRRGKNNTICTRGLIYIRGAIRKRKFIESDWLLSSTPVLAYVQRRAILTYREGAALLPREVRAASHPQLLELRWRRNSCIRSSLRFQAAHLLFTSAAPEHLVGCFFSEKIGKPLNILSREIFPLLALKSISRNASLLWCHPLAAASAARCLNLLDSEWRVRK